MSSKKNYFKRTDCRICRKTNLSKFLELASTPPGNNFIDEANLIKKEQTFPLELYTCIDCTHIQLGHVVDPKFLFQNQYSYVSSTSSVFVKHLRDYAGYVSKLFNLTEESFVVDIGSNDGTCLAGFKDKGVHVLGVDPATEIAEQATKNGINTIADFFSKNVAEGIIKNYGKADLVTSHNACAHIDDLDEIIEGISILLKDNGVFIMEVGYFLDVINNKWFDTVYHEHLDFHTVRPLQELFSRFGLELFRVERIAPQGGSIRIFIQKVNGPNKIDNTINELIELETLSGLNDLECLKAFQQEVDIVKEEFKNMIASFKADGKNISAFGAPTKATTLCYHFEINNNDIDFIVDDNPLKQGLYSPGKHIPVYDSKKIYEDNPDYILILAWNFADSIIEKHKRYLEAGGGFIIPMPKPQIIKNYFNDKT